MRYILCLLLMFCVHFGITQDNAIIDSVKRGIIKNKDNSTSYFKIAEKYFYLNRDSSLKYIELTIVEAEKKNNVSSLINGKGLLSDYYFENGNFEKAENILLELIETKCKYFTTKQQSRVYMSLADIYLYSGRPNLAKGKLLVLDSIYQADDNCNDCHVNVLYRLAQLEFNLNNPSEVIRIATRGLKLIDSSKSEFAKADILTIIGMTHSRLNDVDKAMSFFYRSINIYKKGEINMGLGVVYGNIGEVYQKLENVDSSIYYIEKANKIFIKFQNARLQIISSVNLSELFLEKDIDKSIEYLAIAKSMASKDNFEYGILISDIQQCLLWKTTKTNLNNAFVLLEKTLSNPMVNQDMSIKEKALNGIIEISTLLNNYKSAYAYQASLSKLKDSLFNEEKSKQIAEMETKYDTEKKEAKIFALASENEITSLELENKTLALNQKNYMLLGLGGILLLLGVVGYLFFQQRKIKTEQETAQLEQKLLRTQMNPHFMSNALMSIQTYMYENKTEEAVKYIGRFGKLTRQILTASREDYIPLDEEVKFIKNYLDFQQLMFPEKLDYNVIIDESIEDEEEILIPPMLSQPFIENAIEHGIRHLKDRKGNIQVSFKQNKNNLILEIKDDGVGRTVSHEVNESVRKNHISYSTNITQERIDLFKRKYKKNIGFSIADLAVGTSVTFQIPLS